MVVVRRYSLQEAPVPTIRAKREARPMASRLMVIFMCHLLRHLGRAIGEVG